MPTKFERWKMAAIEIHNICYAGVRGQAIDQRRAEELFKMYPSLYSRISEEERTAAQEELRNFARGASPHA